MRYVWDIATKKTPRGYAGSIISISDIMEYGPYQHQEPALEACKVSLKLDTYANPWLHIKL